MPRRKSLLRSTANIFDVVNESRSEHEPMQSAEWHALEHMIDLGFTDAVFSETGVDRDIQVRATDALAQVKRFAQHPVSETDVRQLRGWAYRTEHAIFYAPNEIGYTRAARAEADDLGVALFLYDGNGVCTPSNVTAQILVDAAPSLRADPARTRSDESADRADALNALGAREASRRRAEFDAVRGYLDELDGWQHSVAYEHERLRAASVRQHGAFHRAAMSGELIYNDWQFNIVTRHAQMSLRIDACLAGATVVRDDLARYIRSIRLKDAHELAMSGWVWDLRPWTTLASTLSGIAGPVEELASAMETFDIQSFRSRRSISRLHRRLVNALTGVSRFGPGDGPVLQLLAEETVRNFGRLELEDQVCAVIVGDDEDPFHDWSDRMRRMPWTDVASPGDAGAPGASR